MADASTSKEPLRKSPSGTPGRKALAAQICAWTVASLLVADTGARIAFQKPTGILKLPMYQQFMISPAKPDVLVVGSSVALCASFCADQTLKKLNNDDKNKYTDALFLKAQLKEKSGQDLDCRTVATAGAMASDAWMLVSKSIEFDKKPKILVYETVSRDLFDASMPQIGDTPVYRALASLHPESKNTFLPEPVVEALDYIYRSPFVTALNITFADTRFLTDPQRLGFCVDSVVSSLSYAYKSRAENRNWLTQQFCALLNRKASLYESMQAEMVKKKERDLYAPLNASANASSNATLNAYQVDSRPQEKRYADELVYFEKLIKLCKKNNIELVVVFLPVGPDYGAKIPPPLKNRYPADSLAIAKRYGIKAVDLSMSPAFTKADFTDHVHLNIPGAVKLTNIVTDDLIKRPMLSTSQKAERNY